MAAAVVTNQVVGQQKLRNWRLCSERTIVIIVSLSILWSSSIEVTAAPTAASRSASMRNGRRTPDVSPVTPSPVYAPFVRCGPAVCDLRVQFCDEVIKSCARCDDDCHPARITGDVKAVEDCKQKCGWFYVFSSTTPAPTVPLATSIGSQLLVEEDLTQLDSWLQLAFMIILMIVLVIVIIILIIVIMVCTHMYRSHKMTRVCEDANQHCRLVDDNKLIERGTTLNCSGTITTCTVPAANASNDYSTRTQHDSLSATMDVHQQRQEQQCDLLVSARSSSSSATAAAESVTAPLLSSRTVTSEANAD
jgi:hypothetical protein